MTTTKPQEPLANDLLDERAMSKLKWRCRRGLLENDLFIERFFARHESTLTVSQAKGLDDLMDLSDNDLMDLLLQRKNPDELSADAPERASSREAHQVLAMLRVPAPTTGGIGGARDSLAPDGSV